MLVWVIIGLTFGAYCVHYSLNFWIGVDPPLYACALIGAVSSGVAIPVSAITLACDLGGIDGPVWPMTDAARAKKASRDPSKAEVK